MFHGLTFVFVGVQMRDKLPIYRTKSPHPLTNTFKPPAFIAEEQEALAVDPDCGSAEASVSSSTNSWIILSSSAANAVAQEK